MFSFNNSETLLECLRFGAAVFIKFRISELAGEVGLLFLEGCDARRQFSEFALLFVIELPCSLIGGECPIWVQTSLLWSLVLSLQMFSLSEPLLHASQCSRRRAQ